jgi:hypothetical protein
MIDHLLAFSSTKQSRSEALQRTVTAALSVVFVLIFLLLLDNLLLGQLKTRVIDRAMDRMQTLQRMNYQAIQQWYGHQSRHLAFWAGSQQVRALLNDTTPVAERSLALAQRVAAIKDLYPELRDVVVFDASGKTLLSTSEALVGAPLPLAESDDAMQYRRGRWLFRTSPDSGAGHRRGSLYRHLTIAR